MYALRKQSAFLSLNVDEIEEDAYMAIRSVMREHPGIFWFSHQWEYCPEQHGVRFNYTLPPVRMAEAKKQKIEPKDADELERTMPYLKLQLKALIARDLWDMSEYFSVFNEESDIVKKALEVIRK